MSYFYQGMELSLDEKGSALFQEGRSRNSLQALFVATSLVYYCTNERGQKRVPGMILQIRVPVFFWQSPFQPLNEAGGGWNRSGTCVWGEYFFRSSDNKKERLTVLDIDQDFEHVAGIFDCLLMVDSFGGSMCPNDSSIFSGKEIWTWTLFWSLRHEELIVTRRNAWKYSALIKIERVAGIFDFKSIVWFIWRFNVSKWLKRVILTTKYERGHLFGLCGTKS